MSPQRVLAVCTSCGRGYSARLVGDDILVATEDGRCQCGNDGFETRAAGEGGPASVD